MASNLFGAEINTRPVNSEILLAILSAKSLGAFRPVPTAVPPRASSFKCGRAFSR